MCAEEAMAKHEENQQSKRSPESDPMLFITDYQQLREHCSSRVFDFIVVGSGFCCFSFVQRVMENNPSAKILIFEKGRYVLPDHFQNLPEQQFKVTLEELEKFPWSLTQLTKDGQYLNKGAHGQVPCFGGKSVFWSAWSPKPLEQDMPGWPVEVTQAIGCYFEDAERLLHVTTVDDISKDTTVYGALQQELMRSLERASLDGSLKSICSAPFAKSTEFGKFSVSGHLLQLLQGHRQQVTLAINCTVKKIVQEKGTATVLQTSLGDVPIRNAMLVLALGTLPTTTLVLNSFPKAEFPMLSGVGERFTGHFKSLVVARIPKQSLSYSNKLQKFELGAVYIAGVHPDTHAQYHIQLCAIADTDPEQNATYAFRHMPDFFVSPTIEQLDASKDHVILVCKALGELDYNNDDNWFRLQVSDDDDLKTNCHLQVVANERDSALWDVMEEATFSVLEQGLSNGSNIEYWQPAQGAWSSTRPPPGAMRQPKVAHEASTMWMGSGEGSPVDLDYRPRGVKNVYITGGSLWPTGGSWNPTAAMVALAIHLADKLTN